MTQYFPFPFLGGNRAMRQIINICVRKEATIFGTGIVNWSRSNREEQIRKIVESMANQISKLK